MEEIGLDSERYADDTTDVILDIIAQHIRGWKMGAGEDSIPVKSIVRCKCDADEHPGEKDYDPLQELDTTSLHHLIIATERWRNYMQNMGYELMQMKEMLTMCEDATIKVRRLVHNFKERMENAEADVWDEHHALKPDFDFKSISSAGIRDIILLHDWYACNAPEKTYDEMGFSSEEEFMQFR